MQATEGKKEFILKDNGKRLIFKEKEFKYRDIYYGFNPFSGQEIVFYKNKIIWSMNYYGKIMSNKFSAKRIYEFLKIAMRKINENKPFRGPSNFKKEDFEYIDKNNGDVTYFSGTETIIYQGKKVYKLNYHGGLIKSRK